MATSGFPALSIQPPASPIQQLGGVMQVRNEFQQSQMNDIKLQEAQQEQRSRATLMQIFSANKGDMNQTLADAVASGQVTPDHINAFRTQTIAAQIQAAQLSKEQLANHKSLSEMAANELDSIKNAPPEQQPQAIKDSYGRLLQAGADPKWLAPIVQNLAANPTPENFQQHEMALMGERWVNENEMKNRQLASMPTVAQAQQKNAAELDKIMNESVAAHISLLSMPSPDEARTARAASLLKTQAETAQANAATAKERAETALMGAKPVIAFDPKTNQRVLTSMPQAQAQGFTNPIQVSEDNVQKDTEATKQFNVMQSAISTYRASVNKLAALNAVSDDHAATMAKILSDKNVFGGAGEHILASIGEGRTNDVITSMRKAANWNTLTPDEQQAMVDYLRAKTAVPLVQKALTGVGRMNAEVMKIDMQMIPSPIEGPSADAKLGAFQKTIDLAAQGLTRVPWLQSPSDVRNTIETKDTQESKNQLAAQQHFAEYRAQNGPGQYRGTPSQDTGKSRYEVGMVVEGIPGKIGYHVSKVYPDGSFDISK